MADERKTPAFLASIDGRGESDALLRCITPTLGALSVIARGLRKPASKLAPVLQPARELELRLARTGGTDLLIGASLMQDHAAWRSDLAMTALYWYMAECALACSGAPEGNHATYQLMANLLRSENSISHKESVAAVFVLKLLMIHGLLPSLTTCALDGHQLSGNEPAHLLPNGEGAIGRAAYNAHYARSGGGMLRLQPNRLARWRQLAHGPLLDFPLAQADLQDASILIDLAARVIGSAANRTLRTAEFLAQQWGLASMDQLLAAQRN